MNRHLSEAAQVFLKPGASPLAGLAAACTQPVIGHTTAQADIFFREAGVL